MVSSLDLFIWLVISHAIGDGFLQLLTPSIAKNKPKSIAYMLLHTILVATIPYIVCYILFGEWIAWVFMYFFITHTLVDIITHSKYIDIFDSNAVLNFDQGLHGIFIIMCWVILK